MVMLSGWCFLYKDFDVCIGFRYAARSTCVVIGFASESSMPSFESSSEASSFYADALLHNIDVHGHLMDVSELLGLVRAEVVRASNGAQTPCVYSASTGKVVLVSLVGASPLSTFAAVTVVDAVRPLLNHLVPQVSQRAFLRCKVPTKERSWAVSD